MGAVPGPEHERASPPRLPRPPGCQVAPELLERCPMAPAQTPGCRDLLQASESGRIPRARPGQLLQRQRVKASGSQGAAGALKPLQGSAEE